MIFSQALNLSTDSNNCPSRKSRFAGRIAGRNAGCRRRGKNTDAGQTPTGRVSDPPGGVRPGGAQRRWGAVGGRFRFPVGTWLTRERPPPTARQRPCFVEGDCRFRRDVFAAFGLRVGGLRGAIMRRRSSFGRLDLPDGLALPRSAESPSRYPSRTREDGVGLEIAYASGCPLLVVRNLRVHGLPP